MSSMDIYLAYAYSPQTTGVYFERAFENMGHRVHYVGTPYADGRGRLGESTEETRPRPGFPVNVDLTSLAGLGMPQPDLVFFVDSSTAYLPRGLDSIDAPTAGYLIDVHRGAPLEQAFSQFFDYVFVAQRDFVSQFSSRLPHANVEWLPLACDPEIHGGEIGDAEFDVGFVGNAAGHPERTRRLELLERHFKVSDWRSRYPKEAIADIYCRSKVVFNASIGGDLNMRVFEGMASGRPLITDRIGNGLSELFEEGVHFLGYSDDDEMIEKIRWCLEHDEDAGAIGAAARDLVAAEHTYQSRCEAVIKAAGGGAGGAPVRSYGAGRLHSEYAKTYSMMRAVDATFDELASARGGAGSWRSALSVATAVGRRSKVVSGLTAHLRRSGRRGV